MEKNTAGKWVVYAYGGQGHASPGDPVTGIAATITANVRIDGAAANATDDVNPTEMEDGYYIFDITAVESNGDLLLLAPQSSTANVIVIAMPAVVYTRPPNFNLLSLSALGVVDFVGVANLTGNVTGDVLGGVSGSVGGDLGGSVQGNVVGSVGSVAADVGITQTGADKVWATTVRAITDKVGFSLSATGLDSITSTAAGFVQIAKAVWDRIISKANHSIGQSAGKIVRQSGDLVQIDGAISDISPTTGGFNTTLTLADGAIEDAVLVFSDGAANAGYGVPISTYLNVNGAMTFEAPDDWPILPVNGDDFVIYATHVHPITQIQALDEIILALLDDPRGEPGQGVLPVNPDVVTKIDYIYKLLRNEKDNDGSITQVYNAAGLIVDHKQTTQESAGLTIKGEWVSGP